MKLAIATNNKNKIKEFKDILSPLGFEIISKKELGLLKPTLETGKTFLQNAKLKALELYKQKNIPTLADDSGLCVAALKNMPGIYSSRYASLYGKIASEEENNNLLLEKMKNITDRRATFVCALCFINSKGKIFNILKTIEGTIALKPSGKNGFAYDKIFLVGRKTFAQLPSNIKNKISHRGKAIGELVSNIKKWV